MFFLPLMAHAGFLASFLGTEVSAANPVVLDESLPDNSQNMALLQANVSPIPVSKEKKVASKDSKDTKDTKTAELPINDKVNINIASENALIPSASPVAATGGPENVGLSDDQVSVYVIRKGDSISQIAEMFDVSVNTILWANDMKKGDKLVEGEVLVILPFSGIEHTVSKGQTLKSIAKLYKVEVEDITLANGIATDEKLAIGDKLMVPDAVKSEESDKPVKNLSASIAKDKQYYETHPIKNLSGYYVNPVPGYRKSQGIHDKNAVDLAIPKGTPIHAAADGKVIFAKVGYNGGYGNLVIISHPNGTKTLYAHQSKIATTTGAQVAQGEVIGYVGSTGRSTGPHLHFEVHGARNPGADGSWAN